MNTDWTFHKKQWFLENPFPGVRRCKKDLFRIDKEIFHGKTKFQEVFIFESPGFGKVLILDGIIQLAQSDEFIYHEVITHIPLLSHKNPRRMLVVGGGDGGVLREALKHPVDEIYFVEIDQDIVAMAKKYLAFISKGAFTNKRVKIFFEDGVQFIRRYKNFFDVVVVDSTDPVGPGKVLFEENFYSLVSASMRKDGIGIFQLGPFLDFDLIIRDIAKTLKKCFRYVNPVRLPMPSYSCGSEYCFLLTAKSGDPMRISPAVIRQRFKTRLGVKAGSLKYYSPEMHFASMVMPKIWQLAGK